MTIADPIAGGISPRTEDDRFRRWEIPLAAWFPVVVAVIGRMPVVGFLLGAVLWPFGAAPLVRLAHRRGSGSVAAAIGLCAALLAVLFVPVDGWSNGLLGGAAAALLAGLPSLFAAQTRRGADPSRAFLAHCAAGFVVSSGLLLALPLFGAPPVGEILRAFLDSNIPPALESYRRAKMDAVTIAQMKTGMLEVRDITVRYWPGLLGSSWVLSCAVSYFSGAWAARPAPSAQAIAFERLEIPAGVAGLFVAVGAVFALVQGVPRTIAGDVLMTLAALYFVAGLSIICHFARRWFRAWILRFGLYVLVAYFPMSLGVALLGLFDWYVHFRRRGEKEELKR